MRSGQLGSAPASRLWWTVPLGLVFLTAVVFVAVVLPALATGPGVPAQLNVQRSAAPSATSTSTPTPTPRATRTSASPAPVRSTTVVTPVQPVVRETGEGHDDSAGSASGEPRDR